MCVLTQNYCERYARVLRLVPGKNATLEMKMLLYRYRGILPLKVSAHRGFKCSAMCTATRVSRRVFKFTTWHQKVENLLPVIAITAAAFASAARTAAGTAAATATADIVMGASLLVCSTSALTLLAHPRAFCLFPGLLALHRSSQLMPLIFAAWLSQAFRLRSSRSFLLIASA